MNHGRLWLLIFFMLFLICTDGFSQESILRRGRQRYSLRGYFEPSYRNLLNSTDGIITSSSILTEDLRLNLNGYFIDNRIFSFNLGSTLINNDIWYSGPSSKSKSENRSLGLYNFDGSILPFGHHPISIFSSLNRNYDLSSPIPDAYTESRVNGGTLSLIYPFLPRIGFALNRTTRKSTLPTQLIDELHDFFEITAIQNWETASQLKATYRSEQRTDKFKSSKNSIRMLQLNGQSNVNDALFLKGVIDYYRFNYLEVLSTNNRIRYNPTQNIRSNFSYSFSDETEKDRKSRRHSATAYFRARIKKVLQVILDMAGNRSLIKKDSLESETSDLNFSPGYNLSHKFEKYTFNNNYSFRYGHHERSDTAKGKSIGHLFGISLGQKVLTNLNVLNTYNFSTNRAFYFGGLSTTTHFISSALNGRLSSRLGLRATLSYSYFKSHSDNLLNRKNTYRGEIQGNYILGQGWTSNFGLRYRRQHDKLNQDIISIFSKIHFYPTNKLRAVWDLSYIRETLNHSNDWVSDFNLDYTYGKLHIYINWRMRIFSNQINSKSNEFYIKIRRSFDFKL
jgi:hypothetical protein